MKNYTILHLHSMDSNAFSTLEVDSIISYDRYIEEAKNNGMTAIAFTEHGAILHNVAKKQLCDKLGLKYIFAEEFYITETINLDKLVRDNYHCCLYAKNEKGVKELTELSSKSFDRNNGHFYYNPRITFEELEETSDNILVLTGCLAGILNKGNASLKNKFINFIANNKHRCWLEVQPHNFEDQILYNKFLYSLSLKHDLRLIATNDIHALDNESALGRQVMQKSNDVEYHDEDECDLTFKTYNEMLESFLKQEALPENIIIQALDETNKFSSLIENYELDYSNKYPRLYDDPEKEFKKRISEGIKFRGVDRYDNFYTDYIPRIKEELDTYRKNDAIDFMLLDSDYKTWLLDNNMHYGVSRGSVSGSLIAYLLKNTDVDSVKYNLNFSRFMNSERMSLADVDTDIYAEDRYKVREYLFNKERLYCCNILTFNTIQLRGAIKSVGRAFGLTPSETQNLSDLVQQDNDGNDFISIDIRNRYKEMFKYVDMVIGTITSLGRHAAGIVCCPTDVAKEFGVCSISSDPRPVSQIDMHEIDSLNYVKLDLLGLNAVGLIDKTCKLANIDFLIPENMTFDDQNVIDSIANDTTLIFQFESGFASDSLKKTLSKETLNNIKRNTKEISYLDIMSMVNGAIRPAGESYREQLFTGVYNDNGNAYLNEFLSPTLGYLVYQEQIIDFLHLFCGFSMGQADVVRRHFSKKEGTENDIPIIENGGYLSDNNNNKIKGFIKTVTERYGMSELEARQTIKSFLQVIDDASSYLFSRNHSIPYSMIGYFIGWLRYYYPLELLASALNVYDGDNEKMSNIKNYINSIGIVIKEIKFGKSKSEFFIDKNENTIYQGISSIKYCNVLIADQLYELSKNKYNNYIDLLYDIKSFTSVDNRQLEILITLNFFSEYGKNNKLLEITSIFNAWYKKSQINKNDLDKLGVYKDLLKGCFSKETEKLYKDINFKEFFYKAFKVIENKSLSVKKQLDKELDFLGNIVYKNEKAPKSLYYIIECKFYKDKTKPYITAYSINSGEILKTKITNGSSFIESQFDKGNIINVREVYERNITKKIGDTWIKTDKKEKILKIWDVY